MQMAANIQGPLILAGDFNMPADSTVYRATWGRFNNAFSRSGFGFGHTERPGSFGWLFGVRIDHILSGPHWRPCRCWVRPKHRAPTISRLLPTLPGSPAAQTS